jgi:hypothetical protein
MLDAERNRPHEWVNQQSMAPKAYVCPFCGNRVSSSFGYRAGANGLIRLCTHCSFPTFFGVGPDGQTDLQIPGSTPGNPVANLPPDIGALYDEARHCVAAGANTAAVLVCRKMLIDLAVSQGDKWEKGKHFTEYVKYVADRVFAPTYTAAWLDQIRVDGNKATHELGIMGEPDALLLIEFIEMLLRVLFEYPNALPGQPAPQTSP